MNKLITLLALGIACWLPVLESAKADDQDQERYLEAGRHTTRGNFVEAIAILDDLVQRYPAVADLYFSRCIAHLQSGDGEATAADARRFLELAGWQLKQSDPDQDSSQWAVILGYFGYTRAGRKLEAGQLLEEAAIRCDGRVWPNSIIQFLRSEITAKTLYERAKSTQEMVEVQAYLGLHLAFVGELKQALTHLEWAIENCKDPRMIERPIAALEKARIESSRAFELTKSMSEVPDAIPELVVPDALKNQRSGRQGPTRRFTASMVLLATPLMWLPQDSNARQTRRSSEDIAKEFNSKVAPIYDELDRLRKKLENAQTPMSEAAKLLEQKNTLQKNVEDLYEKSQNAIDESFRRSLEEIRDYNERNRRLEFESAVAGSKVDLLNNVVKYPERDVFERNVKQMAQEWEQKYGTRLKVFGEDFDRQRAEVFRNVKESYGIDLEAEGYSRIGTSNPYNGQAYYKYYDKSGKPLWVQWQNDAEGWKKYREDLDAVRRRQQDLKQRMEKESKSFMQFENQLESSRTGLSRQIASLRSNIASPIAQNRPADMGELVVGTWEQRQYGNTITFHPDGRFTFSNSSHVGNWKSEGGKVFQTYPNKSFGFDYTTWYTVESDQLIFHKGVRSAVLGRRVR